MNSRRTRWAPSPLVGEGWGEGLVGKRLRFSPLTRPPSLRCAQLCGRPLPPQVGLARLAHHGAESGQARVRWERWTEHVAPSPLTRPSWVGTDYAAFAGDAGSQMLILLVSGIRNRLSTKATAGTAIG